MPHGLMREMMETYKPHILTRRRQLLEDCVRDLRLNNDHIHIVEQEMRKAIQVRKQINKKNFVKTFFTKKNVLNLTRKTVQVYIHLKLHFLQFKVL